MKNNKNQQPEQKLPDISGTDFKLEEHVKKSQLNAEDDFDYQRLVYQMQGLIDCTYEEQLEELVFTYDLKGKKPLETILSEEKERQYQLLINFAQLWKVYCRYQVSFQKENLYYDENLLLYIKQRDILRKGIIPDETTFLEAYKSIICGILSPKYSISQIQESGLVLLKGNKQFQAICQAESMDEIVKLLREKKEQYLKKQKKSKKLVSRSGYRVWKTIAVIAAAGMIGGGGYSLYASQVVLPKQEAVIKASQSYINNDYMTCIDSAKGLSVQDMDTNTKYILAVAYANAESFKKEEIDNIVSKLTPSSNERELEYWISLGRLDVQGAEDLALSLSDDKLLIYAYMKELDMLESNTSISGEEKKTRMDKLEQEITKLGEKYEETQESSQE